MTDGREWRKEVLRRHLGHQGQIGPFVEHNGKKFPVRRREKISRYNPHGHKPRAGHILVIEQLERATEGPFYGHVHEIHSKDFIQQQVDTVAEPQKYGEKPAGGPTRT